MTANFNLGKPLATTLATEGWNFPREGRIHGGVDLRAAVGTPVFAASNGTVLFAGEYADGSGGAVELDHGDGMVTRYLHLSHENVARGQRVARGQQIGLSGFAKSPHLHFDTWVAPSQVYFYNQRFGTPKGSGGTKAWNGVTHTKVPSEPLFPMMYQPDVMLAAIGANVTLYKASVVAQLLILAALGGAGYWAYRHFSGRPLRLT